MMIAHSLPDPYFGPASALHGATYVVDVEFSAEHLNAKAVVIDISAAGDGVDRVLKSFDFRNLDDLTQFAGRLTTTEFMAQHIHSELSRQFAAEFRGSLKVTLHESHIAWASFAGPVG
jgi:6-pyruvoyl-tetrahydropterin synthase